MLVKGGMNSKGQEGVSLTTLLLIILGGVVIIVLIIGFTKGFDFIFGKFDILPGQNLQAVSESCAASAKLDLKVDYCTQFKKIKIDGKDEYINCQDDRLQLDKKMDCDTGAKLPERLQCEKLISDLSGKDGEKDCSKVLHVNGKVCQRGIPVDSEFINKCSEKTKNSFE